MTPLLTHVKRSLFLRLLLIFGLTVILIFAIIYISLQQLNQMANSSSGICIRLSAPATIVVFNDSVRGNKRSK